MHSNFTKSIKAGSLLAVALAAISQAEFANARSQSSILGFPYNGDDAHCFYERHGGPVQRDCNHNAGWVMPMVYDNAGGMNIRVSTNGGNVRCSAFSTDMNGQSLYSSGYAYPDRSKKITRFVNAQGFGGTWMTCFMPKGTQLFNVHY